MGKCKIKHKNEPNTEYLIKLFMMLQELGNNHNNYQPTNQFKVGLQMA